jgi:hypothetical protein
LTKRIENLVLNNYWGNPHLEALKNTWNAQQSEYPQCIRQAMSEVDNLILGIMVAYKENPELLVMYSGKMFSFLYELQLFLKDKNLRYLLNAQNLKQYQSIGLILSKIVELHQKDADQVMINIWKNESGVQNPKELLEWILQLQ